MDKYYAVRFINSQTYRVTNQRHATEQRAMVDCYGMHSAQMIAVGFNKAWRYLTTKQKKEVETKLGVTK